MLGCCKLQPQDRLTLKEVYKQLEEICKDYPVYEDFMLGTISGSVVSGNALFRTDAHF